MISGHFLFHNSIVVITDMKGEIHMITKEYLGSVEELKKEYKIGSVVEQDGKLLKVVEVNDALPTTCFASFPSVTFEEVQK